MPQHIFTVVQRIQYWVSRGSHLYVLCRSVCNRDQNWIKRSKPFRGADQGIKVTSELLKINNQEHTAAIWPLTLENQAIKSLWRGRSSDQAHFLPIKKFDLGRKCFYRRHISDYPLSMNYGNLRWVCTIIFSEYVIVGHKQPGDILIACSHLISLLCIYRAAGCVIPHSFLVGD